MFNPCKLNTKIKDEQHSHEDLEISHQCTKAIILDETKHTYKYKIKQKQIKKIKSREIITKNKLTLIPLYISKSGNDLELHISQSNKEQLVNRFNIHVAYTYNLTEHISNT